MTPLRRLQLFALLPALCAVVPANAAPAQHPVFGDGQPAGIGQLPAGLLRERLEALPAPAQGRALAWLQSFSFPAADVATLAVDDAGGIYYVEPPLEAFESADGVESPVPSGALSSVEAFSLHSRPGAANVVFLDFDGHVIENTAWNSSSTADTLYAEPYDTDGDPSTFGPDELAAIHEIWHRVAEDFAAFDVDVTTEQPVSFDSHTGRVLITRDEDAYNKPMPARGAGGVAYVGVFGASYYQTYQPALVYYDNLGSGFPPYVAEAASHEFGHNLNLSHDGTSTTGYFQGLGDTASFVSWAPVMGVGYYRQVTQWSKGEYPDANNQQDDVAIMLQRLGPRPDDHGNDPFSASLLQVDGSGAITSTNPENDPGKLDQDNKGVIDYRGDVDVFVMELGDGSVDITVTPAWDAFGRSLRRGANLDVQAQLLDGGGSVIASSDPVSDTAANLQTDVQAGYYYLAVRGVGNTGTPYSDYGSQGMYFISGQAAAGTPNATPTAVNDAAATSEDSTVSIAVLANDSDPDGDVISVTSASSPANGTVSIDADSVSYAPRADFHGTDAFTYWIGDGRGGSASATVTVSIAPVNDAPAPSADSAATAFETTVSIAVLDNDTDADGDSLAVVAVGSPGNGTASVAGAAITYTPQAGFHGIDSFSYTVSDGQATASALVTVSVAEPPPQEPSVPGAFQAEDGADGTATLTWSDSEHETAYEIERESLHHKRNVWVGATLIASPGADVTTWTDASGSGQHRYRIRAINAAAASAWTAWQQVSVTDASGGDSGGNGGGKKDSPGGGNKKTR